MYLRYQKRTAHKRLSMFPCSIIRVSPKSSKKHTLRASLKTSINSIKMETYNMEQQCPSCGAPITLDGSTQAVICKYCSSIIAVSSYARNHDCNEPQAPVLYKVEPELRFLANHVISPVNSQGGHIWITKNEVVFKPHSFNFGPLGKRYIRIQDIVGYVKNGLTFMSIFTSDGTEMVLTTWKKNEIINEIEKRRINYYQTRGLSVPPLKYADGIHYSNSGSTNQQSGASGCMGIIVACIISISAILYCIIA